MDMIGFLGKKVDVKCSDGKLFSGHVFDVLDAEDSDIGVECVDIAPLDSDCIIEIASKDIIDVRVDDRYKEFDFRS